MSLQSCSKKVSQALPELFRKTVPIVFRTFKFKKVYINRYNFIILKKIPFLTSVVKYFVELFVVYNVQLTIHGEVSFHKLMLFARGNPPGETQLVRSCFVRVVFGDMDINDFLAEECIHPLP